MKSDDRQYWRLERLTKRITLTEIASYIDRSISYVCQHENGRNTLADDHYKSYCNYIMTHNNNKK